MRGITGYAECPGCYKTENFISTNLRDKLQGVNPMTVSILWCVFQRLQD